MARVTNIPATRRRHKRILKAAKGFFQGRSKLYRPAREAVERSWGFATAHRRRKKRDFRTLWNTRISAEARENGFSYSRLIAGLKKLNIRLDRKSLSGIAETDKTSFREIIQLVKTA